MVCRAKDISQWIGIVTLASGLLVSSQANAEFSAAPVANAEDRDFERLPDLSVIRSARLPVKKVSITATEGENWSSDIAWGAGSDLSTPWITLDPASGTGNHTVLVRINNSLLVEDGPYTASITFTPSSGAAVTVAVNVSIWPRATDTLTREELADPSNWPSDSGYRGAWELWGFLPSPISHQPQQSGDPEVGANVDSWEKTPCPQGGPYDDSCTKPGQAGLASGQSADAAWLLSTGDPRVTIAVLDSGIRWSERELTTQFALNMQELTSCPPPGATSGQFDTYDRNEDGIFSMRDYDGSSYLDLNSNGFLDPQDLIRGENPDTSTACSDGVDDDGNGYMDDICGWDFFWNDNDASDDTDYGHGTGEAKDSAAEGNNGTSDIGICPRCRSLPVRVGDSFIADVNQFAEGVIFSVDSGAKVVQEALGTINSNTYMQEAIDYAYNKGVTVVASAADEASYHHNYPGNAEHTLYVHAIVYDNDGEGGSPWKRSSTFLNFGNCTNYGGHLVLSTPGTGCSSEATGKTSGQAGLVHSYFLQMRDTTGDAYYDTDLTTEESYQILHQSADDINVPTDNHLPNVDGQSCERNDDCAPPWYHCFSGLNIEDSTHQTFVKACSSTKFPSHEGWDEHFGFGRNNARRSLELIRDKRIPPEVDITAPLWFEVVDPSKTPSLQITGTVASQRYSTVNWRLEWGLGVQPAEGEWTELATGQVTPTNPVDNAELGTLSTTGIFADPSAVAQHRDQYTVTLRLVATADSGAEQAKGVFRKTFAIHRDPDLKPGWPIFLGSGTGSGVITDLDGDGKKELVIAPEDGTVHAYRADGSELPGFPTSVNNYPSLDATVCAAHPAKCHSASAAYQVMDTSDKYSSIHAAVAVGDLDGDGVGRSIVIATLDGLVFAFDDQGQVRQGFPVSLDPAHTAEFDWGLYDITSQRFAEFGIFAAPMLGDLDADGDLEIVVAAMNQWVYAWHHDGSQVNGWPVVCRNEEFTAGTGSGQRRDGRIISSPTLADLDGDGKPEIAVGTNERIEDNTNSFIYAIHPDGNAHQGGPYFPGWPQRLAGFIPDEILPYVGRGLPNAPAAADIDGDGEDEIVVAGLGGNMTKLGKDGPDGVVVWMISSSEGYGRNSNTKELITLPLINDPTIADLDGDGRLDVINGTAGTGLVRVASEGGRRASYDHSISAWDLETGYFLDGFPQVVNDFQFFMNYAVADIDGDGYAELLSGDGGYFVHAINHAGKKPKGWPKFTSQWVLSTPAIGDIDDDGFLDVAVGTREGWLYLWTTKGPVEAKHGSAVPSVQWSSFHHDDRNTGNYGTDLGYKIADKPDKKDKPDCPCSAAPVQGPPWRALGVLAALLGIATLSRRRLRQRESKQ